MAIRGRKPKPAQIKQLGGNPGKRPINQNEPQPPGDPDLKTPYGLFGKDGKKLWAALAPDLDAMGILKPVDLPALQNLCIHYDQMMMAKRALDQDGLFQIDEKGIIRRHPAGLIFNQASKAFRSYAADFGLTPTARARLQVDPPEETSLADELFNLRKQIKKS